MRPLFPALAGTILWLTTCAAPPTTAGGGPLTVPKKTLPVPTTVSPELRKFIAALKPLNFTTPTTAEGWRKLVTTQEAAGAKDTRALAKTLGATVEAKTVGGVPCFLVTPKEVAADHQKRLHIHLHGGAYVFNGGEAGAFEAVLVANAIKTRVLSVDYRMAPDHPFPAALEDAVAAYKEVIRTHEPGQTAMFGTSSGGGLTMATVLRLKELGIALPGALFVGTPTSDLTKTGDSWFANAELDQVLGRYEGFIEETGKLYAGDRDMKDPLLSPVYGDLSGFPPTVLISGTRDLLLSNTVRVHRKLRAAGVTAELHVYEAQSHAAYAKAVTAPESRDAMREIAGFFAQHLGE